MAALLDAGALAALTDDEVERVSAHVEALYGGEGLDSFVARQNPERATPRHLAPLIQRLDAARRRPARLLVSMPPGHAKTWTAAHAIGWWLKRFPADTSAYYTYNDRKGWAESKKIRAVAAAGGAELLDEGTMAEWRTPSGGGLLAGGVGGALTGYRVSGLFFVDDPYKNADEANSTARRESIDNWFDQVALTRDQGCSYVVMHTRWIENDIIGRLRKMGGWDEVTLKAEAEPGDVLGRAVGAPLWPDGMYDGAWLAEKKRLIGPYNWSALYQQEPRARGDRLFREPHYYDPANVDLTGARVVLAADPAAAEKTSDDYSAIVVLAVIGDDPATWRAYVLDVYHEQVTVPVFVQVLRAWQARHGHTAIAVEAVGGFRAIPQMLRAVDPAIRLKELPARGDKFTRAQPAAAAWNDGRILVPLHAPWLKEFLDEILVLKFVHDPHDDQGDALAHGWNAIERPVRFSPRPTSHPRRM